MQTPGSSVRLGGEFRPSTAHTAFPTHALRILSRIPTSPILAKSDLDVANRKHRITRILAEVLCTPSASSLQRYLAADGFGEAMLSSAGCHGLMMQRNVVCDWPTCHACVYHALRSRDSDTARRGLSFRRHIDWTTTRQRSSVFRPYHVFGSLPVQSTTDG